MQLTTATKCVSYCCTRSIIMIDNEDNRVYVELIVQLMLDSVLDSILFCLLSHNLEITRDGVKNIFVHVCTKVHVGLLNHDKEQIIKFESSICLAN